MKPKPTASKGCRALFGILIACCAGTSAGCGAVAWESDLNHAMRRAAAQDRLVLAQFWSWADPDCRTMEAEVFSDPDVRDRMREFVCVRLDWGWNQPLAEAWGVRRVPMAYVLRPDGTRIGQKGAADAERFRQFLIVMSLNR